MAGPVTGYDTPDAAQETIDVLTIFTLLAGVIAVAVRLWRKKLAPWWHRRRIRQERVLAEAIATVTRRLDEQDEIAAHRHVELTTYLHESVAAINQRIDDHIDNATQARGEIVARVLALESARATRSG